MTGVDVDEIIIDDSVLGFSWIYLCDSVWFDLASAVVVCFFRGCISAAGISGSRIAKGIVEDFP